LSFPAATQLLFCRCFVLSLLSQAKSQLVYAPFDALNTR